jgi:histidinol-phosphate aminotransferase
MSHTLPFLQSLIQRRVRQDVQSMHSYVVQDAGGMVKLDAMENPHRLSPELQQELGARLGALAINRYPDGRVNQLRQALAQFARMPEGFDIVLGNGSDELISLLSLACAVPRDSVTGSKPMVIAPTPGFVMYAVSAELQGLQFLGIPLRPDFELDTFAMVEAIAKHQPAIVYLAYPNNPTANLWDEGAMAHVIAAAAEVGTLVVVDEAYQPFASRSYLDVIREEPKEHQHVLLMRTMSKFGLAGVRLGYLMGPTELVGQLEKVRPPYNISVLNCECAMFALEHGDVFAKQATNVRIERALLQKAFRSIPNLRAFPSDGNMILVRFAGTDDPAQRAFEGLKARGLLVKNVSKMHPLLADCLRVTVGTPQENHALLTALKEMA